MHQLAVVRIHAALYISARPLEKHIIVMVTNQIVPHAAEPRAKIGNATLSQALSRIQCPAKSADDITAV